MSGWIALNTLSVFVADLRVLGEYSSVIHYTDPKTLETHTTSTKGSVFVLHFELPPSYTCHKDELYGLWQNGE